MITILWSGIVSIILFKLVDIVIGLRVPEEEERIGLDVTFMVSVLTTTKRIITQKAEALASVFILLQFGTYVFHRKLVKASTTGRFVPPVPLLGGYRTQGSMG